MLKTILHRAMPDLGNQRRSTESMVRDFTTAETVGLNVGSKSVKFGPNWVNLDVVAGPGVDVVGDAHAMPFDDGSFDAVVLSAVLQYCRDPLRVAAEAGRVTRPGGVVMVNAPFLQPYCKEEGSIDRFRFSQAGLCALFEEHFDVEESGVTLPTGSALAMVLRSAADTASDRRVVSAALRLGVSWAAWPLSRLSFHRHEHTAGAVYLVGRRRAEAVAAV